MNLQLAFTEDFYSDILGISFP